MNNKKFIVLIDDEEDITSSMEMILELKGLKAKSFADPEEAEAFIKENHENISVIVTDQNMPKKTGLQLVKDLKEFGIKTPCIIASGSTDEVEDDADIADYLEKPYSSDALVECIKKAA